MQNGVEQLKKNFLHEFVIIFYYFHSAQSSTIMSFLLEVIRNYILLVLDINLKFDGKIGDQRQKEE